ncbi:MAG TPA: NADPH:quinone reductase [Trebonia sp.]
MRAVWYDRQGPADEVFQVGELPDVQPGPGEVRVRLRFSGINPGDTKKRRGWLGSDMPFPRVIPHSDGAGVIDAVGEGADPARLGRRAWVFGAQSYRPFGTAAQWTAVPEHLAVDLPDEVPDQVGACLGIPGITAHRAVFADGPVSGLTVLVHGVLGGVGSLAAQLAGWGGATFIVTVRRNSDLPQAANPTALPIVALDQPDPATAIRDLASGGVEDRPGFPFWPLLFDNVTIRLLGSDDFPDRARQEAAADLTTAARAGALAIPVGTALPLEQAATAHDLVDSGTHERVILAIPD